MWVMFFTTISRVLHTHKQVDKSNVLISELAQIADQERTLLEECGDLLLIVSSLEVCFLSFFNP